jgi:hypothetical protein
MISTKIASHLGAGYGRAAVRVARLLLGCAFVVFGLNGFHSFIPAPMQTGLAGAFERTLHESGYYILVFGVQLIAGILLLVNRYIAVAIVLLGAMLVNIWTFHLTMAAATTQPAIVVSILYVIAAWPLRARFKKFFLDTAA